MIAEPISDEERYRSVMRAVMILSEQVAACQVRVDRLLWLLPAMWRLSQCSGCP
jgi:hypothetical protein